MKNNSRTEMLPGKRDFYHIHINKEFWQQFQNYAPPSLRVIRTKFTRIARIYPRFSIEQTARQLWYVQILLL